MYNPLLKTFVCVADCGSFNKASEKLFISAPSIMKQINSLEEHLQMKLLNRSSQGIHLTQAGQIIYKYAKIMFSESEKAIKEAQIAALATNKTFCIGSSILNPCKPFMDLWNKVSDKFPGYKLQVVPFEDDHQNIVSEIGLIGKKYDFIVGVCDSKQWFSHCNFLPLGTYQHYVAVAQDHPLAKKEKLSISDLEGQTLMMVKKGDSNSVDKIREEILKHPNIKIEDTTQFYDMEVFNRCIQSNNIMICIECWKDVHPALVTIPVDWDFPIAYGILYPLHPSNDIQQFIQEIKKAQNI